MKQGMWHLWRYPTGTVEGKSWAWVPTDGRASGKALGGEHTEMDTIHHCPEELGWDCVRHISNILPTSPLKLGVFVCWKQSDTSKCLVVLCWFFFSNHVRFRVLVSFTAGLNPQGDTWAGIPQGFSQVKGCTTTHVTLCKGTRALHRNRGDYLEFKFWFFALSRLRTFWGLFCFDLILT